jgi:hypothetical protein
MKAKDLTQSTQRENGGHSESRIDPAMRLSSWQARAQQAAPLPRINGMSPLIDGGLKIAATDAHCPDAGRGFRGWSPALPVRLLMSWDDCGGGWEGGGVIQDDAPAFGKFSEVEREDAGGLVGFTDKVEFSYYVGGVGAGEMNFQIGEGECAHGFAIRIGVVIAIEDCLPAASDAARAEKFGFLGVPVAGHEGVNVAAIPGGGLQV